MLAGGGPAATHFLCFAKESKWLPGHPPATHHGVPHIYQEKHVQSSFATNRKQIITATLFFNIIDVY
jgi:hypothetical protein